MVYDEYWYVYVDKVIYGFFDYILLLYFFDYLEDFGGGWFVFMEEGVNKMVELRVGCVFFFILGFENLYWVEKVYWGICYVIIIVFSCNFDYGIEDLVFL